MHHDEIHAVRGRVRHEQRAARFRDGQQVLHVWMRDVEPEEPESHPVNRHRRDVKRGFNDGTAVGSGFHTGHVVANQLIRIDAVRRRRVGDGYRIFTVVDEGGSV